MASEPLLAVEDLMVHFPAGGFAWPGAERKLVRAVNGVSFEVRAGETLGLVGESGCGKTTLGRVILGLGEPTSGRIRFAGAEIDHKQRESTAKLRREAAMIFQDPYNALNPRLTAGDTIAEVLRVHRKVPPDDVRERVDELLTLVGLSPEHARRKPHMLSGGQCQRVGIARALAVEPRLIIADECVAALDVSIQAQIINLLIGLRRRMGLAIVFIAHDLAVVRRLCDRIAVMYLGRIVEEGPSAEVFGTPRHPYTRELIAAIPEIDPDRPLPRRPLAGEPPSPLDIPAGCAFHPRCPEVMDICRADGPPCQRSAGASRVACLLYREVQD